MRPAIFALNIAHFYKLCSEFTKPEQQHYHDPRKNVFKQDMIELSKIYLNKQVYQMDESEISHYDSYLKLFINWAKALDARNGYTLSAETRALLDNLCQIWISDPEKYIFSATDGDFAFQRYCDDANLFINAMKKSFGADFHYCLVTFFVPKQLSNDYLFIGTIYHEFGHFYVQYHNLLDKVSQKVKKEIKDQTIYGKELEQTWFEALSLARDTSGSYIQQKFDCIIDSQTEEYMADLFGSQYLGEHLTAHIESNRHGRMDVKSESHPTPNKRNQLISEFYEIVNHPDNQFLQWIMEEFNTVGKPLQKRYISLNSDALKAGKQLLLASDEELHSIFHLAWSVYLELSQPVFNSVGKLIPQSVNYNIYQTINEAVRLSITNYLKV